MNGSVSGNGFVEIFTFTGCEMENPEIRSDKNSIDFVFIVRI